MDWLIIGTVVIAVWVLLLNLSGERINQSQRLAIALARAAKAAAAKDETEIPIAVSAEASLVGSPAAFNRKR